jgi:hypothetical protein
LENPLITKEIKRNARKNNDRGDLLTATGGYTFSYDREGRLEEIIEAVAGDTNKFTFSYTSEGRRFRKIFSTDTSGIMQADTTYYVYDGMFAVAELNGHLDLKSKYVYTNGMLVGRIDADDELFQYFHDGLGSKCQRGQTLKCEKVDN